MKRKFSLVFILAMILTIVAACGADEKTESSSSGKETLVIGIDDTFAPMGFRDDNNEIVGFDIDLATAAADHMGVEVKFQPIDWSTKESELSSGRIDLIWNGYTVTEERKEKVLFTEPYLENAQVVMTVADSKIATLNDLADKQIGIQALSSALDALNANPISEKVSLNEYKDNVLALTDLKAGRIEAVVIDKVVGEYFMTQQPDTFKILEESLAPEKYAVGVKKGNEELLNEVQAALDAMNEDGTSTEISTKWFGEDIVLK
ncbi:amino acid ABC transporter substrate-binding protein [Lysinibacillus sp. SGAir0095]|uniref:amino acid ABC transporter substrate-binding protein n=1 Tax=Lysinibacillus sp. SGAir0095 TaxID=2070463 RepID=UPI0010CD5461|nr:amino acid ABC transporter substrate-binding protein [Lysinibacillus sp. SGAir0095]QCR32356.1 amino acid ABC transporter substrate-binding protein [Lysinibacillus sp. SGAir0095]